MGGDNEGRFDALLNRLNMTLADFINAQLALLSNPLSSLAPISGTIPAGATSVTVPHGAGHSYQGAVVTASSAPVFVVAALQSGVDASRFVKVSIPAVLAAPVSFAGYVY
jgi:hypothetical protein